MSAKPRFVFDTNAIISAVLLKQSISLHSRVASKKGSVKKQVPPLVSLRGAFFCDEAISLLNKGGDCFAKSARNDIVSGSYSLTNPKWEGKMDTFIVEKVVEQLKVLPYELQWRVLEFTRALAISIPHGVPGQQLLRFAGAIPLEDLQLMRQAIEEGCEQVDANEW